MSRSAPTSAARPWSKSPKLTTRDRDVCAWCQAEIDGLGRTYFTSLEDAFRDYGSFHDSRQLIRELLAGVAFDSIWVPNSRAYIALGIDGRGVAWVGKTYVYIREGATFHELPGYSPHQRSSGRRHDEVPTQFCPIHYLAMPLTGLCPDCE